MFWIALLICCSKTSIRQIKLDATMVGGHALSIKWPPRLFHTGRYQATAQSRECEAVDQVETRIIGNAGPKNVRGI